MDKIKFREDFVKIDFNKDHKAFAHYPFQLYAAKDGKADLCALALNDVRDCYGKFKQYLIEGYTTIYMSIDFPATADLKHDLVALFYFENNILEIGGIPYDNQTGESIDYPDLKDSIVMKQIHKNFMHFLKNGPGAISPRIIFN